MWPKSLAEISKILEVPLPAQLPGGTPEINALSTDSRKVAAGELFVAIRGETHDGHKFVGSALAQGAAAAIVESSWLVQNPNFADRCLAVSDTTQALRTLGKSFRRQFNFPVLAIGGSNGKTTTKEMLACLLNVHENRVTRTHKSENGFLGLAITLTQKAHNKHNAPEALVAEIGIDECGAMTEHVSLAAPDVALLTALGPEHLAGLGSWENAVTEELILFRQASAACRRVWQLCETKLVEVSHELRAHDVVVFDTRNRSVMPEHVKQLIAQGLVSSLEFEITDQRATSSSIKAKWVPEKKKNLTQWNVEFTLPMPGLHNAQNFALALATAALNGRSCNDLKIAWQKFVPPEMRSRIVHLNGGVTLLDDCYNASPASMNAAFDALLSDEWKMRHKIVVLGDMLDLGEESKSWHLRLIEKLLKIENSDLCLFGTAMYDVFKEIITNYSHVLQSGNIRLNHAGPDTNPALFMEKLSERMSGAVVLVKGSRGMDLGRFVKSCEAWSSAQG